ncbi:hypothetical protein PoMZ_12129, partial [Pyricularia oryzae]
MRHERRRRKRMKTIPWTPRHVHFTTCVGCASSTLVFVTTTITLQGVMYPPTWRSISPRHVGETWGRNHWSQWS